MSEIHELIKQIQNNEIKKVTLRDINSISSDERANLMKSLKYNNSVTHLTYACEKGINLDSSLAEIIKYNKTITHLDLTNHNELNYNTNNFKNIFESLKYNKSITYLNFSKNFFSKYETRDLRALLKKTFNFNTNITVIDLCDCFKEGNSIGIEEIINSILQVNKTLMQYKILCHAGNNQYILDFVEIIKNTQNYKLIENIVKALTSNYNSKHFIDNKLFDKVSFWADFFKHEDLVKELLQKEGKFELYEKAEEYYNNNSFRILPVTSVGLPLSSAEISHKILSHINPKETASSSIINSRNLADQLIRAIQNNDEKLIESSLERISEFQPIDILKVRKELENYIRHEEADSDKNSVAKITILKLYNIQQNSIN